MVSTKRLSTASASPMSTVQITSPQTPPPLSSKAPFSTTKPKAEPKYCESERVLCYEPDPTKVEVIYDAKILQVAEDIDARGKVKGHQYLVHFQGWNASWDRFVPEEFLLKDTAENKELQKTLFRVAEEARIMNSKKKKKKKKIRRTSTQNADETSLNSSTTSTASTLLTNGDETDQKPVEEDHVIDGHQEEDATISSKMQSNDCSSLKKKKKKKREKIKNLILPHILVEDLKSEPRIGKIVIVNGSKIQTSPVSPIPVKCVTPLPLRSASPKMTLKTEKNLEVNDKPPLQLDEVIPVESCPEVMRRRKRKISADTPLTRVPKCGKRRRTSTKDNSVVANAISASDAIAATAALAKPSSFLKCKEERMSFKPPSAATTPPPPQLPSVANGKRRDTSNGCGAINLSENLKRHLTNDFEMVAKKRRLNVLPSEPNVVNVLEDFVRHYSAGRLVAFEKHQRKSLYTTHRRENGEITLQRAMESIQMCKEVAEGLRILIDFNLQRVLLYRSAGELDQFEEVMRKGIPPRESPPQVNFPGQHHDVEVAIFNGNSPTVSTADSANSITCSKTPARPLRKSEPSSTVDTPQPLNDILSTFSKRRPAAAMTPTMISARRSSIDNMFSTRSSTTSNKDGADSSCSTNSRSTATNRTSILMPPVAASPSTPAAIKVMRNVEGWKLVPDELYSASPPMPSLVYGPIYLLRLFVKLPEILKRMNFPPKTSKLIVKYMDAVLEYFEGHPDLFLSEVYEQ